MKILIVDDSKAMQMIVKRTLRVAGFGDHDTLTASNGTEALGKVHSESPELVLSDWNMPEMNGLELLRALREEGNAVRFGFVTTEATPEMREMASEAGSEFLITKPFTPDMFRSALEPVLG
jgi:two-component system chemotaxis response regulator CheY